MATETTTTTSTTTGLIPPLPQDFQNTLPSTGGSICDQLQKAAQFDAKFALFYNFMFDSEGNLSQSFKDKICAEVNCFTTATTTSGTGTTTSTTTTTTGPTTSTTTTTSLYPIDQGGITVSSADGMTPVSFGTFSEGYYQIYYYSGFYVLSASTNTYILKGLATYGGGSGDMPWVNPNPISGGGSYATLENNNRNVTLAFYHTGGDITMTLGLTSVPAGSVGYHLFQTGPANP